jgi:hypothetical protein
MDGLSAAAITIVGGVVRSTASIAVASIMVCS